MPQKKAQKNHKSYRKKKHKKAQIIPQKEHKKPQVIPQKKQKNSTNHITKKSTKKTTSHTTKKAPKNTNQTTKKHTKSTKKPQVIPQKKHKKHKSDHKKSTKHPLSCGVFLHFFVLFLCFIFLLKIAGLQFSFVLKGSPPPPGLEHRGRPQFRRPARLCLPFYPACQSPALPSSFCLAAESPSLFDWIDIVDHFFTACAQMKKSIGLT